MSSIDLTKDESGYFLEIQIIAATLDNNFISADDCDPYAVCKVGEFKYRTETLSKTIKPQWKKPSTTVKIESGIKNIVVTVNKHGVIGNKIILGAATILLSKLGNEVSTTSWYALSDETKNRVGSVRCRFKKVREGSQIASEIVESKNQWVDLVAPIKQVLHKEMNSPTIPFFTDLDEEVHPKHRYSQSLSEEIIQSAADEEKINNNTKKEVVDKRKFVCGPIIGFIKISPVNELDDDCTIGQKGEISNIMPLYLLEYLPNNFWTYCFPGGLFVSKEKRKPEMKPFIYMSSKGPYYFMFLISDTVTMIGNEKYYVPNAIGLLSQFPIFEVMRRILYSTYSLCPEITDKSTNEATINKVNFDKIVKGLYENMCVDKLCEGCPFNAKFDTMSIEC